MRGPLCTPTEQEQSMSDLKGKVAIVTGASKAHARSFPWSSMRSALARALLGSFNKRQWRGTGTT
jgi:hypothetical protein